MKCLIIAAGRGWRLRERGISKPLFPLRGIPLIERVMHSAMLGGAAEFVVVTGYDGKRIREHLDRYSEAEGVTITHRVNDGWERGNGTSVLCARDALADPFLLVMSDHLFDPAIVTGVAAEPLSGGETILAVDYDLANPLVDLEDVTRVSVHDGAIRQIGKGITYYNAFDTGIFHCTPGLFDAIERSISADGGASLTGGMQVLAAEGKARAYDIGSRFWMDVDGPADARRAEALLAASKTSPGRAVPGASRPELSARAYTSFGPEGGPPETI